MQDVLYAHTNKCFIEGNICLSSPYYFADPHAPPQNVQVVVTGSRTATVTWLPPPLEQQNGQIVYYILIITDSQLGSNSEINSTTTSFMATGLKEYNNYSCIVAAATTVGLGPYSLPVRFTTQQGGKLPYLHSTVVESVIKHPMESDTISTTCFVLYFWR